MSSTPKSRIERKCLFCGELITHNTSGQRFYCDSKHCQIARKTKNRLNYVKKHGKKHIKEKHLKWSRKQGIMPRGQSRYEEQMYKILLKKFKKEDIERNVYRVVKNPYTAGFFELDFYLKKYNLAIEVDGESHRLKNSYGQDRLNYQITNDYLKELACKEKGIILIRVPVGADINMWYKLATISLNDLQKYAIK